MRQDVEHFIRTIREVAQQFSAVIAGDESVTLYFPFWSPDEIAKGRIVQKEWEVSADLIVFYGNWHTVGCVSEKTGEIFFLNDDRQIAHRWSNSDEFVANLTFDPDMERPSAGLSIH